MNCHGCKWLDRYQSKGNGYCAMVVRSKTYRGHHVENGHLGPGSRVRKPEMERCELYEPGKVEMRKFVCVCVCVRSAGVFSCQRRC